MGGTGCRGDKGFAGGCSIRWDVALAWTHPGSAGGNFGFRGIYKKQTLSIWHGDAGTHLAAQMGGDVLFRKRIF